MDVPDGADIAGNTFILKTVRTAIPGPTMLIAAVEAGRPAWTACSAWCMATREAVDAIPGQRTSRR